MGSPLTDQSRTYIIVLLPIGPAVILAGKYSNLFLLLLFFPFGWIGKEEGGDLIKTLVIGLITHPIELIFHNIN